MFLLSAVAALMLGINWAAFAVGVYLERVSEVSLGFYMNPIVTMLLAVVLLKERMTAGLTCVLGLGFVAIIVLTVSYGRFPVVAVVLALSFGTYSLIKKRLSAGPLTELYVETALLVPFAVVFLCVAQSTPLAVRVGDPVANALLLVGAGVISVLPLVLFANSAKRLPLALTGIVQYVSPTAQLLIAVLYFGEDLNWSTLLGFGLVWLAIVIYVSLGARGQLSGRMMRHPRFGREGLRRGD